MMARLPLILLLLFDSCQASTVHLRRATLSSPRKEKQFPLISRGGALPSWTNKVIAGGVSRAWAQALLYPVDALRTLAQTRDGRTLSDVGGKGKLKFWWRMLLTIIASYTYITFYAF